MHSYLSYDASRAHRRGRGDKPKIDIFLLVINVGSKLFFLLVSSDTSTVGSYFQPGEHCMTIILEFFASFS